MSITEEVGNNHMTSKTATQLIKMLSDDLDAWLMYDGPPSEQDIEFQWSLTLIKEARAFLKQAPCTTGEQVVTPT